MKKFSLGVFLILQFGMVQAQMDLYREVVGDSSTKHVQGYAASNAYNNNLLVGGHDGDIPLILKFNEVGEIEWKYTMDGGDGDFNCITKGKDSTFFIAGSYHDSLDATLDICCVKINLNGDTLWTRSINAGYAKPYDIEQTSDGGCIIAGVTNVNSSASKIMIAKLDSTGIPEWVKVIQSGNSNSAAYGIKQTSDSGYIVTGVISGTGPTSGRAFLMKLNFSGNIIWTRKINNPSEYSQGFDVALQNNGFLTYIGAGTNFVRLLKTDSSGNPLWFKKIQVQSDFSTEFYSPKLNALSEGGYAFVVPPLWDEWSHLIRIDTAGNILLSVLYLIKAVDIIEDTPETYWDQFILLGNGPIMMPKTEKFYGDHFGIVPVDPYGFYLQCYGSNDGLSSIEDSVVIATVTCATSSPNQSKPWKPNLLNPKLQFEYGCVHVSGSIQENDTDYHNLKITPNPTSGIFQLSIDGIDPSAISTIEVYNLMGQLISQSSGASAFPMTMDLSKQANGIYYVRVIAGGRSYMQKVVVNHLL